MSILETGNSVLFDSIAKSYGRVCLSSCQTFGNVRVRRPLDLCRRTTVCLLRSGSPPAVFRRVSEIIVDTINTASCWSLPHIVQKVLKALPARAHLNSTPSIPTISAVVGVIAPLKHRVIRLVHGGLLTIQRVAVSPPPFFEAWAAPARYLCVSSPKFVFFSALTANPDKGPLSLVISPVAYLNNLYHKCSIQHFTGLSTKLPN
jgi:hypothetical protein